MKTRATIPIPTPTRNPRPAPGKLFYFQFPLALLLLLLAGCSEETISVADPAAIPFEIAFDGTSRVATGADFRSTWEEGDAIGIFAVKHAPGNAASLARDGSNYINNVRLTYSGGEWTTDPGTRLWWADDGDVLDFYAYYPYSEEATDPAAIAFAVSDDQNAATLAGRPAYNASDVMAAMATNGGNGYAKGSTVRLPFRHVLAMVQVRVEGITDNLSVNLLGCRTAGTLDLAAGTVTTTGNAAPVTMYRPGQPGDGAYDAFTFRTLVPPQSIAAGTRPYVVSKGSGNAIERFPAAILQSPLTLAGGTATRFDNTLKRYIRAAADLVAFSNDWNSDAARDAVIARWSDDATPTGTIRLHADIDMSGIDFTPIGKDGYHPFTGIFDGGGHTISNLSVDVDGYDHAGLFGYNSGSIRDITLKNAGIIATGTAGGIAGQNYGTITGCNVAEGTVKAEYYAGGIAGYNASSSTITGCNVTGGTVTANEYAGGIAGGSNLSTITGCIVTGGTVTANNQYAGGIVGNNNMGTITGCIAAPEKVKGKRPAGICAGYNNNTITACYCVAINGINNVGTGFASGCTSFDKADVQETGFFTATDPTPIELMNTALETAGATVRWAAGNADSGWYPVIQLKIEN